MMHLPWTKDFAKMIGKRVWPFGIKNSVSLELEEEKYVIHQLPKGKGYRVFVELGDFEKMNEAVEYIRQDAASQ